MISHNILPGLALVLGVFVFIELFLRLPLIKNIQAIRANVTRALSVIRSPRISDHWKEKIIPAYAGKILRASLLIAFYLSLICLAAGVVFSLIALISLKNTAALIHFLLNVKTQAGMIFIGVLYAWLRKKKTGSG